MKLKPRLVVSLTMFLSIAFLKNSQAQVSYGNADVAPKSEYFTVKVNGKEIFTNYHEATGNHFSWFSHAGAAEYEITYHKENLSEYRISPMRLNIPSTQAGNTIRFKVDKPTKLIIQVNYPLVDNMRHSKAYKKNMLFLYADEPESNPPKPGDSNVIVSGSNISSAINSAPKNSIVYVPKGNYIGQVKINKSDIALYLAPGANIVNTHVNPEKNKFDKKELIFDIGSNSNNLTIKGRGFIQGNGDLLRPAKSTGFTLEDLVILNNGGGRTGIVFWGEDLDKLLLKNTKTLTDAADGIDPVSCRDCLIEGNVVYSADDAIVIKERNRATYNVTVKNNMAWSHGANALKIGGHFFKSSDPVYDINFIDNDAIYESFKRGEGFVIGTNTKNGLGNISATITNTYNENLKGILDSYTYYYNNGSGFRWSGKVRLTINNMRIRKARVGHPGIYIETEKDPNKIDAIVTFNNLWIEDRYIKSKQDLIDLGYKPSYKNVTIIFNTNTLASEVFENSIDIRIYPNPVKENQISIQIPQYIKVNGIKIYDVLGKEVFSKKNKSSETKLVLKPNLAKGVYIVKIDSDKGQLSKKIIIK